MKKAIFIGTIIFFCFSLYSPVISQEEQIEEKKGIVVLKNANLIDGNGGEPVPDAAIIIEGDKISDIIVDKNREIPDNAEVVINLKGRTIIPGLIDAHTHLATDSSGSDNRDVVEAHLRHNLYGGVTTMRDMAGDVRALADLARKAMLDEIESPDIYYVALMAGATFFTDKRTIASARGKTPGQVPWMQAITPQTDIREAVTLGKGTGATAIKIYADLPANEVKRITEEAHRQNMKVWAHTVIFPARPIEVIEAGVDVISHASMLAFETISDIPNTFKEMYNEWFENSLKIDREGLIDDPAFKRIFELMIGRNTILDATLYLDELMIKERGTDENMEMLEKQAALSCELVGAAHRAGVQIAAGTDFFVDMNRDSLPALHKEIEALAKCGLTPLEVITSATLVASKATGIESTHGTLAVGKTANLVVLNENPSEDIRNIQKIYFVMKNGKIYRRDSYISNLDM